MRTTPKGQVTIPQGVRERTGLLPNIDVEFIVDGDDVRIVKVASGKRPSRGVTAVQRLRVACGRIHMSTDEIMAITRWE